MIEIVPEKVEVLGRRTTQALPFEVSRSTEARAAIRLAYRFLDLRNPAVNEQLVLPAAIVPALRRLMTAAGFL